MTMTPVLQKYNSHIFISRKGPNFYKCERERYIDRETKKDRRLGLRTQLVEDLDTANIGP